MITEGLLKAIGEKEARLKNPLVLAYIGDSVYDLYVRTVLVKNSRQQVNALHHRSSAIVNAAAQARAAEQIEQLLTEDERQIMRRGRNAHPATTAKNMSVADYKKATGLEALIGYHFLAGNDRRIEELMKQIIEKV